MAKQTINVGQETNDGGGDPLRVAFTKINQNFDEVYADILSITSFSGSYNDLTDTPDLSNYVTQAQLAAGSITVDVNNTGDLVGSVFADDSTLLVDGVNGIIPASVISGTITNAIDTSSITKTNGALSVTAVGGNLELGAPFNNVVLSSFADISLTSNYIQMSAGTDVEVFADSSVQIKAPLISIGVTEDDSTIAIGQHNINNTTTTNLYGDYVFYNRGVEFNGSDITFGDSTKTPTIDFSGATISNWTDPDVVNKADNGSNIITVGQTTAVIDNLSVRIAENTPGEIDVEFNYDPEGVSTNISANGDSPNRFNGTTSFAPGNTTWTAVNVLSTVGDKGEMTIVDHNFFRIYRVTTIARTLPNSGAGQAGDALCVIERLK